MIFRMHTLRRLAGRWRQSSIVSPYTSSLGSRVYTLVFIVCAQFRAIYLKNTKKSQITNNAKSGHSVPSTSILAAVYTLSRCEKTLLRFARVRGADIHITYSCAALKKHPHPCSTESSQPPLSKTGNTRVTRQSVAWSDERHGGCCACPVQSVPRKVKRKVGLHSAVHARALLPPDSPQSEFVVITPIITRSQLP